MKRSKFSLSHHNLFSCDMGELIPAGMFEVLPGDTVQANTSALIRAAYLLAPVMHPVNVRLHWWFVPYRLIWTDFEKFITGGPDGLDATAYPTRNAGFTAGGLADYLGVPPGTSIAVSDLPFRAYALIWNEWYRDEDLQTLLTVNKGNGLSNAGSDVLQNCDWEKDYFTSARPWEQKGPTVSLPLGTSAPIALVNPGAPGTQKVRNAATGVLAPSVPSIGSDPASDFNNAGTDYVLDPNGTLFANLASATAVTINTLRQALALQRFEEARSKYGSRYTEYLRYLGVRSSDARLQRPEYLGGGRQVIQFSEVLQTGPSVGDTGVGKMRGHGITAMRSNRFRRYFEEHGIVMCLMSVRPKTMYQNGLKRMFNRRTKEDFWQVELQNLGQQSILNKEIYAAHASPDGVFGYQDRYDEYRRQESGVAGEFRTSTLNFWHMARDFAAAPALNASFVSCVPTERSFAVPSEDVLYIMANHSIQARRMLSATAVSKTF